MGDFIVDSFSSLLFIYKVGPDRVVSLIAGIGSMWGIVGGGVCCWRTYSIVWVMSTGVVC